MGTQSPTTMDHLPASTPSAPPLGERAQDCDIRLTMPARAENVAMIRHVCGALAEGLHMPTELVADVRLAVTEACTNVVRHAYAGAEAAGPIDVIAEPLGGCLTVVVSDRGCGIDAGPESEGPGLGLPLIAALSHGFEIEHGPQQGSRLRMSFRPHGGRFLAG